MVQGIIISRHRQEMHGEPMLSKQPAPKFTDWLFQHRIIIK